MEDFRYGWPVGSMQALFVFQEVGGRRVELVNTSKDAPEWLSLSGDVPMLPTGVLPLGFAANSLLVAGLILAVVYGPGPWLRWARRRGGRCVGCGYDRTGTSGVVCPECGEPPVAAA